MAKHISDHTHLIIFELADKQNESIESVNRELVCCGYEGIFHKGKLYGAFSGKHNEINLLIQPGFCYIKINLGNYHKNFHNIAILWQWAISHKRKLVPHQTWIDFMSNYENKHYITNLLSYQLAFKEHIIFNQKMNRSNYLVLSDDVISKFFWIDWCLRCRYGISDDTVKWLSLVCEEYNCGYGIFSSQLWIGRDKMLPCNKNLYYLPHMAEKK